MAGAVYETLSAIGRAALSDERDLLNERLGALRGERSRYEAELKEIDRQIAACTTAIEALSTLLGVVPQTVASPRSEVPSGASGDSIIDAVGAAFGDRGNQPLHYRELAQILIDRGIVLGGKDPAGTLLSIITNARYSNRFERCARGTYRPVSGEAATPSTKLRKSRRRRRAKRSTV
jgi:hypothetical protein